MTTDEYDRIIWSYSFDAIKFKVRMRSEQFLITSNTVYESITIALSMLFGGKSSDSDNSHTARARTAEELQRELEGFLTQ